jgi:membrane-bound lytic murein transglycosylase F
MVSMRNLYFQIALILALLASASCRNDPQRNISGRQARDLPRILEDGSLVAITDYNSTNYFIYRGQPMGYQYELLQDLARHLDIRLEMVVSNDLEETFNCLRMGDCDLIALNLTVTRERKKQFDFTVPHSQTRQVFVQRKPEGWDRMPQSRIERELIRNQLELGHKKIYVQQNSSYYVRLRNLEEEIGDSIDIIDVPEDAETLIMQVADGLIDYTVADENVALVNQTYYPNLDVGTAISFPQNLAWAVNSGSDALRKEINKWLIEYRKSTRYAVIYNKYFKNRRSASIVKSELFALSSGRISVYDEHIKEHSGAIGWDWRLLASLVYQESRFDPKARSWAGAFGLMQFMPSTARRFNISESSPVDEQIRAGTEFIRWLDNRFDEDVPDPDERIKFILAAYNVGPGHIFDAMALAEKHGMEPDIWTGNVEVCLLKKSDPEYFLDPVVKYGYARGRETHNYVIQVLERYEHYRNLIEEETAPAS